MLKNILFTSFIVTLMLGLTGCGQPTPQTINTLSEDEQITALQNHTELAHYIKQPSQKVQIALVKQEPAYIENFANPSLKVQLAAVKTDENSLCQIKPKNRFEVVQIQAIQKHNGILKCIAQTNSQKVRLAAISKNVRYIRLFQNPSIEVQIAAVRKDPNAILYIQNPSLQTQLISIGKKYHKTLTEQKTKTLARLEFQEAERYSTKAQSPYRKQHEKNELYKKAFYFYTLSAQNGYIEANYLLAQCYAEGHGVKQSYTKAAHYYEKAADNKHPIAGAKYNACYMYYKANSWEKALTCFKEDSSEKSINNLALMYENGKGVAMNKTMAYQFYSQASQQGSKDAKRNKERLCKNCSWVCK